MEAVIVVVFVASLLGIVWHAHRGERVGAIEGAMLRSFGGRRRLRLQVRRVRSAGKAVVQISGLVYAVYRSASVSPEEARAWADALERREPRICGRFEIARDAQNAQAGELLVTVPLDFNRFRLRLLVDRAQGDAAARALRAAAEAKRAP